MTEPILIAAIVAVAIVIVTVIVCHYVSKIFQMKYNNRPMSLAEWLGGRKEQDDDE